MAHTRRTVAWLALMALSLTAEARPQAGGKGSKRVQTLLAWTPKKAGNNSMVPKARSTLEWWSGFGAEGRTKVTETGNGTTFTQIPHMLSIPPTPADQLNAVGTLDHVKHLAFAKPFPAANNSKLVYSLRVSPQVKLPAKLPYNVVDAQDDIRLGSCCMNFIDFSNMLVADTFLTNNGIWALYERLPFGRQAGHVYAAFSFVKRLADRKHPSQKHDLQIKYDKAGNALEWWVDGDLALTVGKIGYKPSPSLGMRAGLDLGGTEELITLAALQPGFGCFTLLDFAEPNGSPTDVGLLNLNPTSASPPEVYVVPSSFKVDTRTNKSAITDASWRLYGQGTSMTVSSFKVTYEPRDG